MATRSASLFGVDTNFLLDLADKDPVAWKAFEVIRAKASASVLTTMPTVLDELANGVEIWAGEKQQLAITTLTSLKRDWKIESLDLIPTGHGLVELAAEKILGDRLLPESERNDAFIIAEAALMNCALIITSDRHMRDIDPVKLRATLKARDLGEPSIKSPKQVISMFGF